MSKETEYKCSGCGLVATGVDVVGGHKAYSVGADNLTVDCGDWVAVKVAKKETVVAKAEKYTESVNKDYPGTVIKDLGVVKESPESRTKVRKKAS